MHPHRSRGRLHLRAGAGPLIFTRIRRRLTLGYVCILAVILLGFSVVVVVVFREATIHRDDDGLIIEARALADRVARDEVDPGSMNDSDEYAWSHLAADGRLLQRDSTALDLGLPMRAGARRAAESGEPVVTTGDGPGGGVIVASVPMENGSGEVVQVGRSLQVEQETVARLVTILASIGLGALALAGAGGLFMSRRALRPVHDAFEKQRAFVADASHELKTPLSLAKLDGEVLLRDPNVPDAGEILGHQLLEIDRMDALLSELLLLARLDAGKLDVERETFDLAAVLVESTDRFQTRATLENIALDVSVPGKLPTRGDRERTAQILAILLDNAVRHTPEHGHITAAGFHTAGKLEATVKDTGPGIPPEHLPHVFDRFYRADPQREARTRESGGTGLGLAIARDLARAQGGDLIAENAEGGGAILRLSLPKD
ncbi:MAG: sensor histidine kinase [Rubrobacteraceae bacterium]